ncbi:hypothetical protein GQ42DRAFT_162618 [Ramicandelaber brevisporus]|nr:hypothetical protein GQ42DRAFT_162618 [Ramicandelaber brevisporus]
MAAMVLGAKQWGRRLSVRNLLCSLPLSMSSHDASRDAVPFSASASTRVWYSTQLIHCMQPRWTAQSGTEAETNNGTEVEVREEEWTPSDCARTRGRPWNVGGPSSSRRTPAVAARAQSLPRRAAAQWLVVRRGLCVFV